MLAPQKSIFVYLEKGVCTLFSVFQYFQNDWDNIVADWYYTDKEGNRFNTTYKDHFLYCTKTPSSLHNKLLVNEEEGINNGLPCGSGQADSLILTDFLPTQLMMVFCYIQQCYRFRFTGISVSRSGRLQLVFG